MNHSELYFSANEQLRLRDLIPVTKEVFDDENKESWPEETKDLSFAEWKEQLTEVGYDVSKIYRNKNKKSIRMFFYVGDYSAIEIHSIDPDWLSNPFTKGAIKADNYRKEAFLKGDYTLFFFPESNSFAIDFFIKLYKEIDVSVVWETFIDMYVHADYGFHMLPEEVLEYLFQYADNTESIEKLEDLGKIDKDGYVTIYRGEGKLSTPLDKTLSWTLSKDVAIKFGTFYKKGNTYEAKVKAEHIIQFIDMRNEDEILVLPKHVESIKTIHTM